jgi:hypothetical protein
METVSLLFSTSRHPMSAVIRACTWSNWSHVAVIDGDEVIEATAPAGVRRFPVVQAIDHAKRGQIVELPCLDPGAVIAAAASQLGKPYDYTAVLGLGIHRDWQEEDAWFCSELVAWAFQHAGEPLFRADCLRRVTPQHLWMLAPALPPPDPAFLATTEGRLVRPSSF